MSSLCQAGSTPPASFGSTRLPALGLRMACTEPFVNEPPLLKALRSRIAREAGSYFERRTAAEAKRLQLEWPEHIFEIQLISDYFKYMEKNDASIRSIMTTFNRDACAAIYRPLLFPTKQWATTDWAGLQAPFKDFAAAISGGQAHSDEFVFLENGVNSMKGSMFNGDIPKPKGNPLDNYVLVVRMALVFEYMRDVKVVDSWTKSSDRFFDACLRLESAIKTSPTFVSGSWQSIQWTSGYRTREAQMLLDVQTKARGARDTLMALAISQATTNEAAARTPAERALWTKMKSELQTAKTRLFSDAAFTIDKI
ncbi:MAG: hypothetical protein M1832_001425 [Thelocarpon impressellum]|nr:MAG: hypothetical protein M1832_001425 [Thelocarpon impressellum]